MKRVLYIICATLTALGCTNDPETEANTGGLEGDITFSITDDLTRVWNEKRSWAVGEYIAIFEGTDDEAVPIIYQLTELSDEGLYTLSPEYSDKRYVASTGEVTYTAYYPYLSGYTLSDYKRKSSAYIDVLRSQVVVDMDTHSGAVNFETFDHANAYANFVFVAGDGFEFNELNLSLKSGDDELTSVYFQKDGAKNLTFSAYIPLPSECESLTLYATVNGNTDDLYALSLSGDTSVNPTGGVTYTYCMAFGEASFVLFKRDEPNSANMIRVDTAGEIEGILSQFRRCMMTASDGEAQICYLKDDNSNYYSDGTTQATLTGGEGDVMVYFPEY